MADQITADGFEMTLDGSLCTLRLDKLKKSPKNRRILSVGTLRLTNQGLTFSGKLDGQDADFDFNIKSVYSMTFSTKGFLEFYCNNDYYMIVPDDKDLCLIKWTLASEEVHNLHDERWRSACADVYGIGEKIYE